MSEKITLNITGMTCEHCVNAVSKSTLSIEGVSDVHVDLESNTAEIAGENFTIDDIILAINDEGYQATLKK
jgi:copper chaperone